MTSACVRVLAAAAALLALASCPTAPTGSAETVVALTVTFDAALAVDQLAISFALEGAAAFSPALVPDAPQDLDGAGELLEFVLDDELDRQVLTMTVAGLGPLAVHLRVRAEGRLSWGRWSRPLLGRIEEARPVAAPATGRAAPWRDAQHSEGAVADTPRPRGVHVEAAASGALQEH